MTVLAEFLEQKGREQNLQERRKRAGEWTGAVHKLFSKILKWLKNADRDRKYLDIVETTIEKREEGLGWYEIPALKIVFGKTAVEITPVAGNVAGSVSLGDGRELQRAGRVDFDTLYRRAKLYRVVENNKSQWYLSEKADQYVLLDQKKFEELMLVMFS